jgi:hypothetical protein
MELNKNDEGGKKASWHYRILVKVDLYPIYNISEEAILSESTRILTNDASATRDKLCKRTTISNLLRKLRDQQDYVIRTNLITVSMNTVSVHVSFTANRISYLIRGRDLI